MRNFILFFFISIRLFAFDGYSFRDSIDVQHYYIHLFIDVEKKQISGNTIVELVPLYENMQNVTLDFQGLSISKILINKKKIKKWTFQNNKIKIPLPRGIRKGQLVSINIFYSGTPQEDSFWGGFYFKNKTAFNLGVGMASVPHSYGRVWFPCSDHFKDKAFFDFYITVPSGYTAVCGGLPASIIKSKQTTFHWSLLQPVSPYLASVSVAQYDTLKHIYKGLEKDIPVFIYVFKGKKDLARKTFKNLDSALRIFESLYGPYPWDRVGYNEILFDGGAMEHVENISISFMAIKGTLKSEPLLYHELAHSWFGNYVTCATAEDMWLNEGWAEYNEAVFLEKMYGKKDFKKYQRLQHFNALNFAHKNDYGYRPLAPMDLKYTYGTTVYKKGADVVHTLRFYLGDSLFFPAVRAYLDSFKFSVATTENLKTFLSDYTKTDLTDFFDFWVYSSGFPFFRIYDWKTDSTHYNIYNVSVVVDQQVIGGSKMPKSNRLHVTFLDKHFRRVDSIFYFSGKKSKHTYHLPFKPVYVGLDIEEYVADATTDEYRFFMKPDSAIYDEELTDVLIDSLMDTAFVRVQCNWLEPDNVEKMHGYLFQKNYYWTVEGVWNESLKGRLRFYLTTLMDLNFTKLRKPNDFILFYRESPSQPWRQIAFKLYNNNYLETDLRKGDFALAVKIYE